MAWPQRVITAAAGLFVVLVVGIWGAYRWSNTVPRRPRGVRRDAVSCGLRMWGFLGQDEGRGWPAGNHAPGIRFAG